ncbi:MAG: AI-2E family transporter [Anaerolineae bacterium]|nr:AI-2E family transporter [Anaerolineae bacterium]
MNRFISPWMNQSSQRRKRLLLFFAAILLVLGILWASRSVLGLYFIGLLFAYILSPVVDWLQRGLEWIGKHRWLRFFYKKARSLSIIITYLLLLAVIAGFIALVVPIIVREASSLWEARESIWDNVYRFGEDVFERYQLLPDQVRVRVEDALTQLSTYVTRVFQQALQGTVVAITYTTSLVLAITIVPFWVFFLLRDIDIIHHSLLNAFPGIVRKDVANIWRLLDRTLSSYLRGQILLCIIIGVLTTIVMSILGLDYALLLGVVAGVLEVVPNIGPTLAAIPAILLALTRGPGLALLTAVAANLIQNVENSFVVPRVLGNSVGLHPVLMMVMLVVGTEIAGLPGLIIAPLLAAILRDLYRYLHYRFADDPFSPEAALDLVLQGGEFSVEI